MAASAAGAVEATGAGAQLRAYRERAGLSQEALAERAGLAAAAISALERGVRRRPFLHTVAALAAALGLSAAERAAFAAAARPPGGPAAAGDPPSNLPLPPTPLIGREREAAALGDLLGQDGVRLVTLTGVGGAGKTRLALHVAADLHGRGGRFPAGVWLVELAPVADPALVPHAVAAALAVRDAPGAALLDGLVAALRPRALLLVLDNCEHVLAACAALAERLLAGCPGVRILATSREPLQIAGERQRPVPPLAAPDPGRPAAVDDLARYPAVRLFVARAQAVVPGFVLTPENAAAAAQVCARLDGIPLALELAAARVGVLAVAQVAARLDDCLRLLTGGSRAGPTRQQTLRGTLDWSHDLLAEPERVLFRRLAVFAGGFDLEAAEAVCADDALEALTHLVHRSLVVADAGAGAGGDAAARYRLLEPVRQYARQRLAASGEEAAVHARHRDWCLALAEAAAPALGGREQLAWLARLDAELDNLRQALAWCGEHDPAAGLRLAGLLAPFWRVRSYYDEGSRWLAALLDRAPGGGAARAAALLGAAALTLSQWDLAGTRTRLEEALALSRALGDAGLIAAALRGFGNLHIFTGDLASARAVLDEGLARARTAGDRRGLADHLLLLGVVAYDGDELLEARSLLEESLAQARAVGDRALISTALWLAGRAAMRLGDVEAAERRLLEGLDVARELGAPRTVTRIQEQLAGAASWRGDLRGATAWHEAGLALARETGDEHGMALHVTGLGRVAHAQGDHVRAARLLDAGLARFTDLHDKRWVAASRQALALVACSQGDAPRARGLLRASLAARRELGDRAGIAACLEALAAVAAGERPEHALRLAGAADALRTALGEALSPAAQATRRRWLEPARRAAGARAAAAWADGQTLAVEQAIASALADAPLATLPSDGGPLRVPASAAAGRPGTPAAPAAAGRAAALTARERQVAALLAGGCHTDRQIAERLTITPGTAGVHVQHLLAKLDLHSRWEIAGWAIAHGLGAAPGT
jgi:predicted ATPase/DNA-binding CsgD family transcriptional regulator/DNA-binding XRE family transcriptional regulator